jgi:surface antigen
VTLAAASVAELWHNSGMARARVSTTVDEELLTSARRALAPMTDAAVLDAALAALLDRRRAAEIDATYVAYEQHPIEKPDAWGDLASFRVAAAES